MNLASRILEQIAVNTRAKIEEYMLIVMDKSTHEEHLSQSLQTNNKRFNVAITFLTGYNGIFSITTRNNKFHFTTATDDDDFSEISFSPGAYELESLNDEIKRDIFEKTISMKRFIRL